MKLTQKGQELWPNRELTQTETMGDWVISVVDHSAGYVTHIAYRALEVKALIDLGIIEL